MLTPKSVVLIDCESSREAFSLNRALLLSANAIFELWQHGARQRRFPILENAL